MTSMKTVIMCGGATAYFLKPKRLLSGYLSCHTVAYFNSFQGELSKNFSEKCVSYGKKNLSFVTFSYSVKFSPKKTVLRDNYKN